MRTFGTRLVDFSRGALPVALVLAAGVALAGCCKTVPARDVYGCSTRVPPPDLPANPDPCLEYCRVWVPPTYRKVPKLVCVRGPSKRVVEGTKMEARYREVMVKPPICKTLHGCGTSCEEQLVQVAPGGWRWQGQGDCWSYDYCPPKYRWCNRIVHEEGIDYCVEHPAEYKTVVESVPVQTRRCDYVPPQYEIRYVNEVWKPGRYEWQARPKCCPTDCCPDTVYSTVVSRECLSDCPPPVRGAAIAPGCPRTN